MFRGHTLQEHSLQEHFTFHFVEVVGRNFLENTPCFRNFGVCFLNSANLAQLVEQLIRNEQAVGSSPMVGSPLKTSSKKASNNGGFFYADNSFTPKF